MAYNAAIEEFDQGFKDEKELNLWIEKTVNHWQKFQAMNPSRKPKSDKDALSTIKELEARVTTQEAAISKIGAQRAWSVDQGDSRDMSGNPREEGGYLPIDVVPKQSLTVLQTHASDDIIGRQGSASGIANGVGRNVAAERGL